MNGQESWRCRRCRERWAQYRGLCRRCHRELGFEATTRQLEAARVERMRARQPVVIERSPRPTRTVVVGGEIFEVTWDGS